MSQPSLPCRFEYFLLVKIHFFILFFFWRIFTFVWHGRNVFILIFFILFHSTLFTASKRDRTEINVKCEIEMGDMLHGFLYKSIRIYNTWFFSFYFPFFFLFGRHAQLSNVEHVWDLNHRSRYKKRQSLYIHTKSILNGTRMQPVAFAYTNE